MIVKDFSTFVDEKGEIPLVERIRGTFRFGGSWYGDIQAQETIINRLQNALNDEFILLRNLTLPGLEVPIPIVLAGPTGVQTIYGSSLKGIFQAQGEQWRVMNTNSRRFREAKPNLINRAMLLNQAISRHLEENELGNVPVEPVLIFTDPGVHVDNKGPAARIVMIDALDRYAASLASAPSVIAVEKVQSIVSLLTTPARKQVQDVEEARRIREAFTVRRPAALPANVTEVNVPVVGPLRFTNRQWAVLGALFAINILAIAVFILLTLILT